MSGGGKMRRSSTRWIVLTVIVTVIVGIGAVPAFASVDVTLGSAARSFSPNGDGQEDTLTVSYYLSQAANVDVVVHDAANADVRVLLSGASHAAGWDSVTWDGKNTGGTIVANGAYTLAFQAVGATGSASATYATAVDARVPGVLNQPQPGETLSGMQSFVFTPTAGFSGIGTVAVDCIGQANAPAGNGTFTASGDTSTTCPDGAQTIAAHVSFTDGLGASHTWDSPGVSVTLVEPVRVETAWTNYWPSRVFSPNGDGQEDSVATRYCLSRTATVDIVVKNESGTIVRTLQSNTSVDGTFFATGGCGYGQQAVSWDGKNNADVVVPDGNYSIVVDARDSDGNTATAQYETAVDTRQPGTLTVPASGATLAGNASFMFTPTAGFDALSSVSVDCLGSGTLQGDGTWAGSGDSAYCDPNTTSMVAYVGYTDKFGTGHSWQSPPTPIAIGVQLRSYSASRSFSPDGDGQEDSLTTTYCLSRDSAVTVTVHNSAHALVRTLESSAAHTGASCNSFAAYNASTWDGKNALGDAVADGDYTIDIHAVDSAGKTDDLSVPTAVDTRTPGALTTPASDATLTGTSGFVFTPTPGFYALSNVSVDCLGSGTAQGDGTWTGSGNTANCGPNTISIAAHVGYTDKFASTHSWQSPPTPVTIAIQLTRAYYDVSASFSPNGDGQEDSLTADYCLSGDATVTIAVHNSAHTLVRTLESNVARSGNSGNPCGYYLAAATTTWDGKSAGGVVVPDGDYTIDIHAVDSAANTADLSIPTTVDTRVPGAITSPASGATLSGTTTFVFTPTAGFATLQSVWFDCFGSGSLQGDGTWTASGDATGCGSGFTALRARVNWIDGYGTGHSWTSPAVSIGNLLSLTVAGASAPTSFSPNGDGQEDSLTTSYCLSRDAAVTITVHNAAHALVRTLESGAAHTGPSCPEAIWDGRNTAGDPVPDGAYTIDVHAVGTADSTVADASAPTTVESRAPGLLTEPHFGETLQGLVHFSFTPQAGFVGLGPSAIDSLRGCFSNSPSSTCISILNASPDGVWRTTAPASALTTGAADFTWSVTYHDTYGTSHTWSSPVPVAVSINANPNPLLAVGASPSSGPAPVVTTLHFDLSDSQNRPLAYTANFGDGSATVAGTIPSPYTGGVSLPHTYSTPGSFLATVSVSNGAGGSAQKTVSITASGTEQPPTATLAVAPASGFAPAHMTATFTATDPDTSSLTYSVDFGDGTAATTGTLAGDATSGPLPGGPFGHTYTQAGLYTVRLAVSDGHYSAVRARAVSVGSGPLAANAGDDRTAIVNQSVHFDGSASRPLVGITSYNWDFGDGNTATGAQAVHTFTTIGQKTVHLTVHVGAVVSVADTMTVFVSAVPATPGLSVTVTGASAPVSGADVAVVDADGTRHAASTGNNGVARIDGLPDGKYAVYAYHDGFFPATATSTVASGTGSATIALTPGSVGQTSLTASPMTRDQIIAAGIDPNDPANQNVYQFEIHLAFVDGGTTYNVDLGGYTSEHGVLQPDWQDSSPGVTPGGGDCLPGMLCASVGADVGESGGAGGVAGGVSVYPQIQYVGTTPTIVWMVIPGRAKWLKEFFDVRLVVSNLGSAPFTFQNGTASLDALPSGLSLAPTASPQSLAQTVPDIPGGGSATAHWVVRGDEPNFYTLTARYAATLEPLGSNVQLLAATSPGALHVWGGSALRMTVDTDDAAALGSPYRVRIGLKNVADVPVFNPSVEFLQDKRVLNYIYQPGEKLLDATDVIQPGTTFFTHYFRLVPEIHGSLNPALSFVKKTAGNSDIVSTIVPHATVAGLNVTGTIGAGGALTLTWPAPPVANISGYRIYRTPTRDTPFGTTPLVATGATTRTTTIAHPSGYYAISTLVNGVPTMYHTLFGVPTAPTSVSVIPGNASALVKWQAPFGTGGSPITAYAVTPFRGTTALPQVVFAGTATSGLISGLANGSAYSFHIVARNAMGTSPLVVTAPVAAGTPGPVTATAAVPANGAVTVTWSKPTANGTSAITSISVTPYLGAVAQTASTKTLPPTSTTATFSGLTNGTAYSFRIVARNAVGVGPAVSSTQVVVGAPQAPTNVRALSASTTVATGSLTVSYTAGSNNGSPITGYTAACTSSSTGVTVTGTHAGATVAPIAVTGLMTAQSYICSVSASNARGAGPASAPSASAIVGSPAPPSAVSAVKVASGQLKVTFTPGANNGSAISAYGVACSSSNGGPTATKIGSTSPITVTGLASGKLYTCVAFGHNSRGDGVASQPSAATTA